MATAHHIPSKAELMQQLQRWNDRYTDGDNVAGALSPVHDSDYCLDIEFIPDDYLRDCLIDMLTQEDCDFFEDDSEGQSRHDKMDAFVQSENVVFCLSEAMANIHDIEDSWAVAAVYEMLRSLHSPDDGGWVAIPVGMHQEFAAPQWPIPQIFEETEGYFILVKDLGGDDGLDDIVQDFVQLMQDADLGSSNIQDLIRVFHCSLEPVTTFFHSNDWRSYVFDVAPLRERDVPVLYPQAQAENSNVWTPEDGWVNSIPLWEMAGNTIQNNRFVPILLDLLDGIQNARNDLLSESSVQGERIRELEGQTRQQQRRIEELESEMHNLTVRTRRHQG